MKENYIDVKVVHLETDPNIDFRRDGL